MAPANISSTNGGGSIVLTKTLIRHRTRGDKISPLLIDPGDRTLLAIAEELIGVFRESAGRTRAELLEGSAAIIEAGGAPAPVLRGFEKLLLDRTDFDTRPDPERLAFRERVFAESARLLGAGESESPEAFRGAVAAAVGTMSPDELMDELYGDLPERQPVVRFRPLTPERFLHRYNAAQVQGLLIYAAAVTVEVPDRDAGALRQLFKYLRFRQLLADIRHQPPDRYAIRIDGPLNLFYQSQKYGLNLAVFFPAILHQPEWRLTATVGIRRNRTHRLELDSSCGIQPWSHAFLAYVPEEVEAFRAALEAKADDWTVHPASEFLPLPGDRYCFPDFSLIHASGETVALELFHPWHASHLDTRLTQLEKVAAPPLLIGVSRALLKDEELAARLEGSAYFQRWGFLFREMPTVGKVTPLLDRLAKE